MGQLVEGRWHDVWYDTARTGGHFAREAPVFRNWVRADGSTPHSPAAGRYHLYVCLACPWAHCTLIARHLKGLQQAIAISVVDPYMGEQGWSFRGLDGRLSPGCTDDALHGSRFLHEVYTRAKDDYTGRVTVPVLWDKQNKTIVSNESADIVRMFDHEFGSSAAELYPAARAADIDAINARVYTDINNGVYRCGFATTQAAYLQAYHTLFAALQWVEGLLQQGPYLLGSTLSEADIRLWTTLARFDPVYHGHFKCNKARLTEFPNLWRFTRTMYALPACHATLNLDHIKQHYYRSHKTINPTGIVPAGPDIDWQLA